ncbi:MAG: hypothetical protein HC890_11675 [Chloroflexaceae bacterium]|nr:hypothetical protein [Chloroflexaceae bacterium]
MIGAGGSLVYGWQFGQKHLINWVEAELSDLLNRPVQMSGITGWSWRGLHFGKSQLPPTPGDRDWATVEGVTVSFEPWELLRRRELALGVSLIRPEVYIEQDEQERWLDLVIDEPKRKKRSIKTQLQFIRLQDAQVTLVARSPSDSLNPPVKARISEGIGNFGEIQQKTLVEFDLTGKLVAGGDLKATGTFLSAQNLLKVMLGGKTLAAPESPI